MHHDDETTPPTRTTRVDDPIGVSIDWDDIGEVLRSYAEEGMRAGDGTGLFLAAAAGDEPLLLSVARPFEQGHHHAVVVELASLALGFGADRIAVAVTGRAWSDDDPIPPVTDGVDLRQRVLVVTAADGHGRDVPEVRGTVVPFAFDDGAVTWREAMQADDGEGWIPSALAIVVTQTAAFAGRPGDLADQFRRCDALGHVLDLSPSAVEQLLAASVV